MWFHLPLVPVKHHDGGGREGPLKGGDGRVGNVGDGEVAEVCRQAEQILLQGGDSGGEVDLDPAVRQVVFALITLVRTKNKSSFTLPFKSTIMK